MLVRCWGEAWHTFKDKALEWRNRACFRERFLLGKLVISGGLFDYMAKILGFREAKSIIFTFQKNIVDKLDNNLTTYRGGGTRLRPYVQSDWTEKMELG